MKAQVMRGALIQLLGEIVCSPFYSWAPDERTEIQTDPVTPAFVGCVCVCVCARARTRAHVYSRVCGWLLRTIPFQG